MLRERVVVGLARGAAERRREGRMIEAIVRAWLVGDGRGELAIEVLAGKAMMDVVVVLPRCY